MLVHLVDDNDAFRRSTAWCLELDGFEVREFPSAERQLEALGAGERPDIVLCDVRMPGMSGLEFVRTLRAGSIRLPVVLMTGHGDIPLAVEAMRGGANDFLEKPFEMSAIAASLHNAMQGGRSDSDPDIARRLDSLTARERQVLDLVVAGRLNKQIADDLGVSIKTVELHRHNMMNKLAVRNLADLMKLVLVARGTH